MINEVSRHKDLLLSEERLKMVLEGSQEGFWDWDITSGKVKHNDRWAQLLGYSTIKEFEENSVSWTSLIHPDDRNAVLASINDHLEGRTAQHEMEYRVLTKGGKGYKWILDHAKIVARDASGRPLRMCGTHLDISDRKQRDEEKDELIKSLQDTLNETKSLKGIIPICSYCHNIRDNNGSWDRIDAYISKHSEAKLSHSICPECIDQARSEADLGIKQEH